MKTIFCLLPLLLSFVYVKTQTQINAGHFSVKELNLLNINPLNGKTVFSSRFITESNTVKAGLLELKNDVGNIPFYANAPVPALIANKTFSDVQFLFKGNDFYFDSSVVKQRNKIYNEIRTAEKSCTRYTNLMKQDSALILKYYMAKINAGMYYPVQIPVLNGEGLIAWFPSHYEFPYNLFQSINSQYVSIFKQHFPGFGNESSPNVALKTRETKIFPNPASDIIQIDAGAITSPISIINAIDQMGVKTLLQPQKASESAYSASISELHEGIFTIQVIFSTGESLSQTIYVVKR